MELKREPMSSRDGAANPGGRSPQLQDAYLAEIKRQAIPVVIYLVNGFQLRGTVKGFDPFTIVLEYERKPHLIYKHAVSTISPQGTLAEPFVLEAPPGVRESPDPKV